MSAVELVALLPQKKKKYSQVEEGDIIIDAEHHYPWRVAKVVHTDTHYNIYDCYDNGLCCSRKKNFMVKVLDVK